VATAIDTLVEGLPPEILSKRISDGWHDRRDKEAAELAADIANGGASSLLIQACDEGLAEDNMTGDPGADLRLKLQQRGLDPQQANLALTRTLFWTPAT